MAPAYVSLSVRMTNVSTGIFILSASTIGREQSVPPPLIPWIFLVTASNLSFGEMLSWPPPVPNPYQKKNGSVLMVTIDIAADAMEQVSPGTPPHSTPIDAETS